MAFHSNPTNKKRKQKHSSNSKFPTLFIFYDFGFWNVIWLICTSSDDILFLSILFCLYRWATIVFNQVPLVFFLLRILLTDFFEFWNCLRVTSFLSFFVFPSIFSGFLFPLIALLKYEIWTHFIYVHVPCKMFCAPIFFFWKCFIRIYFNRSEFEGLFWLYISFDFLSFRHIDW